MANISSAMAASFHPVARVHPLDRKIEELKGESIHVISSAIKAIQVAAAQAPAVPAPVVPAPVVPAPAVPAPVVPAPAVPASDMDPRIAELVQLALKREDPPELVLADVYDSSTAYALAKLEEAFYNKTQGTLTREHEYLTTFIPELSLPPQLPDVIGTLEAPGAFCCAMDARLRELEEHPPQAWLATDLERFEWPGKLATWKESWQAFKRDLMEAPEKLLFSHDPDERRKQYQVFAYQLHQVLQAAGTKNEDAFLLNQLSDIRQVCYTGWQERIAQLVDYAGVSAPLDYQLLAQRLARDLRRAIATNQVLPDVLESMNWDRDLASNVHNQLAMKQWGNEPFALGYSSDALGKAEIVADAIDRKEEQARSSFEKHYSKQALVDCVMSYSRDKKFDAGTLLAPLLDSYQEALLAGRAPFLDEMEKLSPLYDRLKRAVGEEEGVRRKSLLSELFEDFKAAGVQPTYSLDSPRRQLIVKALKTEGAVAELLSSAMSNKLKALSRDVATYAAMQREYYHKTELGALLRDLAQVYEAAKAGIAPQNLLKFEEEVNPWLSQLAASESQDVLDKIDNEALARARSMAENSNYYIANHNCRLLAQKLMNKAEITPFGLEMWLAGAKLTAIETGSDTSMAGKLLVWAFSLPLLLLNAENLIEMLDARPELYSVLSEEMRSRPEVEEKLIANPGLRYGISRVEYDTALSDPISALKKHAGLRSCREIVWAAVQRDGKNLQYASDTLKADREIVMAAISENGFALEYASEELRANSEIVLTATRETGLALQYASVTLKGNSEIVKAAVLQNGEALQHASADLKANCEIVLNAVRQKGSALKYAGGALNGDREIAMAAVCQNGLALQYVDADLNGDKEIAMAAARQNGLALQYVIADLNGNSEIVKAAVLQNGEALQYASADLKANHEIVLAAVCQKSSALKHANAQLRANHEIALAAVSKSLTAFDHISNSLKSDSTFMLAAVKQNGLAVRYISNALKTHREIILSAVCQNGLALGYANDTFKRDSEIVMAAVCQDGMALRYAGEDLCGDRAIALAAVRQNGMVLEHSSLDLLEDKEITLAAVSQNGMALEFASDALKGDRGIVMAAVSQNSRALKHARVDLQTDPEIVSIVNRH